LLSAAIPCLSVKLGNFHNKREQPEPGYRVGFPHRAGCRTEVRLGREHFKTWNLLLIVQLIMMDFILTGEPSQAVKRFEQILIKRPKEKNAG
jgi:hypothetical protein